MSHFVMLTIILVTSLLTGSVLCYTIFILLKRVQKLEHLLSESKLIMQNMSDAQKSNLENQTGKSPIVLILSKNQENKGETMTNEQVNEVDKTIH